MSPPSKIIMPSVADGIKASDAVLQQLHAQKGASSFRRQLPRLKNFQFVMRDAYYQKGIYCFGKYDSSGERITYNAKTADGLRWVWPWWLLYRMWKIGALYPSPNLHNVFTVHYNNMMDLLKKGGR